MSVRTLPWTVEEDAVLAAAPAGATYDEIAARLGRTARQVADRARRLGTAGRSVLGKPRLAATCGRDLAYSAEAAASAAKAGPAERRCLGCGRGFASIHAGNRLCARCAARAEANRSALA